MQAVVGELSSKEGRVTNRTMARLLQHLLSRNATAAQRGWVLDGWPRTAAQARLATSVVLSLDGGSAVGAAGDEGPKNRRESLAGPGKVWSVGSHLIIGSSCLAAYLAEHSASGETHLAH